MKAKTCRFCEVEFIPRNMGQKVCSVECAIEDSRKQRTKAAQNERRAETKRRKAELKTPSEAAKGAQAAFNKYIRFRDSGEPCISCGKPLKPGPGTHAGHYRTTKAAPQLRFNTFNCHAQCFSCNTALSGNILEQRIALVRRYGEDRVLQIENNQELAGHDMAYYERLRKVFSKRTKHLTKLRDA